MDVGIQLQIAVHEHNPDISFSWPVFSNSVSMYGTMAGCLVLKRFFDIVISAVTLVVMALPMLMVAGMVYLTSPGSVIYWSDRVGRNNTLFRMPKFRTMRIDAPTIPSHMMFNPDIYITPIGGFLRRTSLDELPQFWSILIGDMSVVGPRPALFNQSDLIALRTELGVEKMMPGLTGWAQINGRDDLPIPVKVQFDVEYMQHRSFWLDLRIIALTFIRVLHRRGVSH